ncbi:MAG: sulfotransferase [Desulfobulbaceae bacterium]|nr:sulfotransferase [Desulfobulbaceae bacterium]HIJ90740.1 sulfotransferase [Deltaproteobacteria bacterium]
MRFIFMLRTYLRVLRTTWQVYGFGPVLLAWLLVEPALKILTALTMALDHLFFPNFRKVRVARPIFILGHPRSGTTFLHHLLTQHEEAAPFHTWHLFFPALTARVLFRPLVNLLVKKGKGEVMPEWTGHRMALDKTEEEEMLFLHNYDTNFLTIGMLSFDERTYPELQYHDRQPRKQRLRSMRFLDGCFRRHIHYTGKSQIIAQTHFSTFRLKTMLEFYPDARFIFIMRNPHHVAPSFLSLLHNSIEFRWGLAPIRPELLARYNERRFQGMVDLYRYFYELDTQGELPADRVMLLPYAQLRHDLTHAFERIEAFTGLPPCETLRQAVRKRAGKQGTYQRRHKVKSLAEFGLSRERISQAFAFVFSHYGLEDKEE